jgi:hypothetical protein
MNSVGSGGEGYVGAGVQEQVSSLSVLSSQWGFVANYFQGLTRQCFQLTGAQIFFAKLDVVDSSFGGFGDLKQ